MQTGLLDCAHRPTGTTRLELLQIITLALIQGITEFLPISSSAHLVLPAQLSDWPDQGLAFDVAVHLGSLTAVLVYFRGELRAFVQSLLHWLRTREVDAHLRLLLQVVTATLPVVVCGFWLKDWIELHARSIVVIAATTIGFGLVLWVADRRHRVPGKSEFALGWAPALAIGLLQALALIPGTSRSGITITGGLLLNLSRGAAARFSFLLSIPTILGAAVLSGADALERPVPFPVTDMLLGFALSALSAYVCIRLFIGLIERTGMLPYVIYRLILGTALLAYAWLFLPG